MPSDTVFRPALTPEPTPSVDKSIDKVDEKSYDAGRETCAVSEFTSNLEAWETEGKKKYVNEYFDTHNISSDFSAKMSLGTIDKFVRSEMEDRKYAKTIDNYRSIISEIESEIGSNKLELFERFKKLTGYIKAMTRLREIKKKLGAYKPNAESN